MAANKYHGDRKTFSTYGRLYDEKKKTIISHLIEDDTIDIDKDTE